MPKKGENVYHRKDGLWEARFVKEIDAFGKKKYGSVYAKSCREAKEKRQTIVDSIRLNQVQPVTRNTTLSQLAEEWLHTNQERLKPSTLQKYRGFVRNHIERYIGRIPVVYCTTASIHQFTLERLQAGVSHTTVNSILVFIHSCLRYGHRQYGFTMPEIMYVTSPKNDMRVLSKAEQVKLMEYLRKDIDIYKFGVILALYTGLRVGELCALEWADIEEDRIKVRRTVQRLRRIDGNGTELHIGSPKTKTSGRDIPIPSFLSGLIDIFREKSDGGRYVLSQGGTKLVEPRIMQLKFTKFTKELGISGATFHTLRHTFATRCVECGFEIKSLSEILGHANVQVTLSKYVHSSFELKAGNMEKLGQVI